MKTKIEIEKLINLEKITLAKIGDNPVYRELWLEVTGKIRAYERVLEVEKEPKNYYYAHIVTGTQTKNKLQNAAKKVVESYGNKIYTVSEFLEVKKEIVQKIDELNKQFSRCTPLNPNFSSYDNVFNLYGLEFIYLYFYQCTMYKN